MERVTPRLPKRQLEFIDTLVLAGEFSLTSEALRTAAGDLVNAHVLNMFNRM